MCRGDNGNENNQQVLRAYYAPGSGLALYVRDLFYETLTHQKAFLLCL